MAIERWDPFREVVSLRDAMSPLLQESFVRPGSMPATGGPATLPLDVAETATEFVIKPSLPGIEPEDVQIIVHGGTLTIRGERISALSIKGRGDHRGRKEVSMLYGVQ